MKTDYRRHKRYLLLRIGSVEYKSRYKNVGVLPIFGILGVTFRAKAFRLRKMLDFVVRYANLFTFRFAYILFYLVSFRHSTFA